MLSKKARLASLLILLLLSAATALAQCPTLVWSDEFDGNAVNEANWSYQTGGTGWGNNELQFYRPENATVSNGTLKITAKAESYRGKSYTSTRMHSINKADFTYGRFEARIKVPIGQGIWPAFWMMPTDDIYGGWPKSGEIDIMENLGSEPATSYGTLHYGDPAHQFSGAAYRLYGGQRFTDDFNVFAIEKDPNEMRWYIDDVLFLTRTPGDIQPEFWPFEERFHFILNLAVGGNWPGNPDASTVFPQVMEVDYVRVYAGTAPSISGERNLSSQAPGEIYAIANAPSGTSYSWTVPAGASIVSGQGTSAITVNWGLVGGDIIASLNNSCGTSQLAIKVNVEPPLNYDFAFENFDDPANITFVSNTGVLTEISNPDSSGINGSALSAEYIRNSGELYDTLFYTTTAIPDASEYVTGARKFYIDLYTTAPIGTELLIQLENSNATPANFPTGRHSRYQASTGIQNAWERIEVDYLDRPDTSAGNDTVTNIVILFAPNSMTGDSWTFDNFDSYLALSPGTPPPAAPNALVAQSNGSSQIDLSWNDNANDEDGFKIERSSDGVSYTQIATTGANTTSYADTGLASATTWYYRIRAYNSGGDSAWSNGANATTDAGNPASTMHVNAVTAATQGAGKGQKYGKVTVTIVDNLGNPVAGATVSGDFSGSFNESSSGTTDAAGSVVLLTNASAGGIVNFTFCVTGVTQSGLTYDAAANVITCDAF